MNTPKLVTVGITTYNHQKYIDKCIRSVLNQSYSNIKIIVCDDCSTDDNVVILNKIKSEYPDKIELILNKVNQGVTHACNQILKKVCSEYFCAIGGDDLMYKHKIEKQVKYLDANKNTKFCFHNLDKINLDTGELLSVVSPAPNSFCRLRQGTFVDAIKYGCFFHCCSIMWRLDKDDLLYDERLGAASDWLYFTQLLYSKGTADHINETLGVYGRTPNSITSNRPKSFTLELDLLNSCNILLLNYPSFKSVILRRYADIWLGMRFKDKKNYIYHTKTSWCLCKRFKTFIIIFIHYITFKKKYI